MISFCSSSCYSHLQHLPTAGNVMVLHSECSPECSPGSQQHGLRKHSLRSQRLRPAGVVACLTETSADQNIYSEGYHGHRSAETIAIVCKSLNIWHNSLGEKRHSKKDTVGHLCSISCYDGLSFGPCMHARDGLPDAPVAQSAPRRAKGFLP